MLSSDCEAFKVIGEEARNELHGMMMWNIETDTGTSEPTRALGGPHYGMG